MTMQISPVLAGTFDTPNAASSNNLNFPQTDDADAVDSRRYTKFDRSTTDAGTATMSFDDFVDMINPLEHIPVVSSIYREVVGENISPVARTVGDIVYGGIAGVASAVIGGIAASADSVIESQTGKDATGNIFSALFEDDPSSPAPATQLAQTTGAAATTQLAQAAAPFAAAASSIPQTAGTQTAAQINAKAKLQAMAIASAASAAAQSSMPSGGTSSPAAQMASSTSAPGSGLLQSLNANPATALALPNGSKSFALDPKKLPYGGVMTPPLQGNNMAVSLANSAPGMQMNHMVYTGKLMNGVKASATGTVALTPGGTSSSQIMDNTTAYVSTSPADTLPPALMNDITALRAINTYRSTAGQSSLSGADLNVLN